MTALAKIRIAPRFSVYLPMRDGVRIAVEVWLPNSALQTGAQVGTIGLFTRYWRAFERSGPSPYVEFGEFGAAAGFAVIHADARGSGASYGHRIVEYSDNELRDMGEVISWVAQQPWSNGRVATTGISYLGNTAELAAVYGGPHLKAAAPLFTDFDFYDHILFPGGLMNQRFFSSWASYVQALDRNDVSGVRAILGDGALAGVQGVQPVDGDDGTALASALADHLGNEYYHAHAEDWVFRDDVGANDTDVRIDRRALFTYRADIEAAQVPMRHWIGWMDSATAMGALARFATFDAPNEIRIGPWNHGALSAADPFKFLKEPTIPTVQQQREDNLDFFAPYLSGDEPPPLERSVIYYTMGADRWTRTTQWPPAGVRSSDLYLAPDGLRTDRPQMADSIEYEIDFEAGTGALNRWATSMGGTPVEYGDRAEADQRLLTFTGAPLEQEITITGHPQVTLHISSTHDDGAFIVYLEAVTDEGRVVYLTEGVLRAVHRRTSNDKPPYAMFGPYRSFLRKDALFLVPGERAELTFNLIPTSVRIPAGWRLRVALAGHDKDTFARIPATGTPRIRVFTGGDAASLIRLPLEG